MKCLDISILKPYKMYKENTEYHLEGDLIILSGVNGSGKSQLLKIISQSSSESISRVIMQSDKNVNSKQLEEILLLSFRDNINLGNEFGHYSVIYKENFVNEAWNFYCTNIRFAANNQFKNNQRKERFLNGTLIADNNGIRNPSWRSIKQLMELIKYKYPGDEAFHLTQTEVESLLPQNFIWRNENDIIAQVGNLFYIACCERVNRQLECSESTRIFNNNEWLKTAPWTILNKLFSELGFKYRFKTDYKFITPNLDENPQLRDGTDIRGIQDLSDGEKAILKLALISLDEEISKDIKLVLFDEYDAPLNPSLTEAFYHVIDEFYIKKGIQVIIATHSPATISLAPEYAQFYELFSQKKTSPKIVQVNQYDYNELRVANKKFYDRIKDQSSRITELEKSIVKGECNCLFVEDRYDQIYKIAYLKTKGISGITEENLERVFSECCPFSIHGNFSTGGLYSQLICSNITHDNNGITICLFDFDSEGFQKFEEIEKKKDNSAKLFNGRFGSIRDGLYLKHYLADRYAIMIPIPDRLKKYVSEETSSDCFIEIESLLSEDYLKSNSKVKIRSEALPFYMVKNKHKHDFWKDLLMADKEAFDDFVPLFKLLEKLFGYVYCDEEIIRVEPINVAHSVE